MKYFDVDTFRKYSGEVNVSTAKTHCHGRVSMIRYYWRGSVLKVSTAQGIPTVGYTCKVALKIFIFK